VPLSIRAHFEHHKRFYASAALGVLTWTLARMFNLPEHLAVAGDTFFGVYLLSMLGMAQRSTPSEMRTRAAVRDEGITLIVLMTLAAIGLSVGSLFALLNEPGRVAACPGTSGSAQTTESLRAILARRHGPYRLVISHGGFALMRVDIQVRYRSADPFNPRDQFQCWEEQTIEE